MRLQGLSAIEGGAAVEPGREATQYAIRLHARGVAAPRMAFLGRGTSQTRPPGRGLGASVPNMLRQLEFGWCRSMQATSQPSLSWIGVTPQRMSKGLPHTASQVNKHDS